MKKKLYFLSGTMCTAQLWDFVCDELTQFDCVFIDTTSAISFDEIDQLLDEKLEENLSLIHI